MRDNPTASFELMVFMGCDLIMIDGAREKVVDAAEVEEKKVADTELQDSPTAEPVLSEQDLALINNTSLKMSKEYIEQSYLACSSTLTLQPNFARR